MTSFEDRIRMAKGEIPAPTVFKNARVVDVFSKRIVEGDIAVCEGFILGVGSYSGVEEIDLCGKYVSPSLIDAHVHIESSLVSPPEFAKALLVHGVGTIIADPHEIANVAGLGGINYILEQSYGLPLDVRVMLPSCVPCTSFENNGALLEYRHLETVKEHPRVLGLGEMMNYVGVLNNEKSVIDKLVGFKDKIIDGHAPGLMGESLNAYVYAGVTTDHECSTVEEMNARISAGMYVLIREGTAARNARSLLAGVNKENLSRCMFCTDDKHPEDLVNDGSIDHNVRIAMSMGIEPVDAIALGSINAAQAYGLKNKGAIAPGYEASFVVLSELDGFKISDVYVNGNIVADDGKFVGEIRKYDASDLGNRLKVYDYTESDFAIKLEGDMANVIEIVPNELITVRSYEKVLRKDGYFVADNDVVKLAVIERHKGLKSMGLGLIKGLGLKNGAIASTIAHDSHNLIIAGDSDSDMYAAMKEIVRINGGFVLVQNGEVIKSVPLEIGGLMSNRSIEEVNSDVRDIMEQSKERLSLKEGIDPIITLGFMALPVIPHIKLTDKGIFNVDSFNFIGLEEEVK